MDYLCYKTLYGADTTLKIEFIIIIIIIVTIFNTTITTITTITIMIIIIKKRAQESSVRDWKREW